MSDDATSTFSLSRRSLMKIGGTALVAVWSHTAVSAAATQTTGKALLLAPDDASDVAVHSRVENLFWSDVMMEHAGFFAMLMPGNELAQKRAHAESFQRSFQAQYDRAKNATIDKTNYAAFNRTTVELIRPFIDYKRRLRDAHASGRIRTLVFPSFFDHTAREAERAVARLEKLAATNIGNAGLDFVEVVDFWSAAMSEHNEFIAHLLDPQEDELIGHALDSSAMFKGFRHVNRERRLPIGEVVLATEEIIDFETVLREGMNAGRIKSILNPTLVDHMRRETLKFIDELKRSGART
jgi:hypothetical protein